MDGGVGATLREYGGGEGVILLLAGGEGATRVLIIAGDGASLDRASDGGRTNDCLVYEWDSL